MKIKKYDGATMTEALEKVKQELGPEAVILNVRSDASSGSVEITAALDVNHDERADFPRPERRERRAYQEKDPRGIAESGEDRQWHSG
ncbi:MAG: hypothetical protein B1H40_04895 [Candidatus Latescibacteria bacterium 4484_181]|nr:MAG: hypothetical protein B1H40_04895 [Candidatus Latescibacteria bacterium 4484_181]